MRRAFAAAVSLLAGAVGVLTVAPAAAAPSCTVQIVAHTDDDLLFMNPDIQRDVRAGACVRTAYLTAGDAGREQAYWARREAGVKQAYATMAGAADGWTDGTATVAGRGVPRSTLTGTAVSLVFLRLPDGFDGNGSARYGGQSLQKLWEGLIPQIAPVDGSSSYTRAELIGVLRELLEKTHAGRVRLQDFRGDSGPVGVYGGDGDHHDHHAAAYFGYAAQRLVTAQHEVVAYRGYSTSELPANVAGADLELKKATFFAYTAFDELIGCKDDRSCAADPLDGGRPSVYRPWLSRQYPVPGPAADGSVELRAVNGRCLDVRGVDSTNGTLVQLWDCAGAPNQRWTVNPGVGEVRGFAGKCLDADPTGRAVRLWDCTGGANQTWTLTTAGELRGLGDRCLDVRDPALPNGAPAELGPCTGESRQKWRAV